MPSRIPRPAGAATGLSQRDPNAENIGARKRKIETPVKSAPPEPEPKKLAISMPTATVPAASVEIPSTLNHIQINAADLEAWNEVSQTMNWSVTDCLEHKLTFAKRADAKSKLEAIGAHLKRVRFCGWHLLNEYQTLEAASASLKYQLDQEQASKLDIEQRLQQTETDLQSSKTAAGDLQTRLQAAMENVAKLEQDCRAVQKELFGAKSELDSTKAANADTLEKLKAAENAVAEAQKYASTLQQYNTKVQDDLSAANESLTALQAQAAKLQEEKAVLTEEAAALRGKATALGEALSALQAAAASTEASRTAAIDDATKLRAELAMVIDERSAAVAETKSLKTQLDDTKNDLERYRIATGKDLATLEKTQARTKAQAEINANLQDQVALLREERTLAQVQAETKTAEAARLAVKVAELEAALAESDRRLHEGEQLRRKLHNTILELKGNIRVFCRVRPIPSEKAAVSLPTSGDLAGRAINLKYIPEVTKTSKEAQEHTFSFDRVFGQEATQEDVFEEVSQLVQSALDGYKVCLFAYGQTGAGKTHTMLGTAADEGIIPRATRQVFNTAAAMLEQGWTYQMKAAMVEVYNEELRDLLGKPSALPAGKKHQISHDDKGNLLVSYLEWAEVGNPEQVQCLMTKAMKQRAVGATAMNDESSRSHMVFMLDIVGKNESTGQSVKGMLNLVDLAGSERLAKSGATGGRLKETQNINKSLSALGDVINALGSKEQHIPYRNSKLTFLLQNSLSGTSKTLMLCSLNPSSENAQETLCTLRFASKVNSTEIGTARRNV